MQLSAAQRRRMGKDRRGESIQGGSESGPLASRRHVLPRSPDSLGAFRTESRDSRKGRFRSCGERAVRLVSRRHGELEARPRIEQEPPRHDLHGAQLEHRHESERTARMTPERWQQIKAVLAEAMEKPTGERDAFVE